MTRTRFGDFQDFPWPRKFVRGGVNLRRKHGLLETLRPFGT
jgi:hypothetical protein